MAPKFQKNFQELTNRQKRRRISCLRNTIDNHADDSTSDSEVAENVVPLVEKAAEGNDVITIEDNYTDFDDEEHDPIHNTDLSDRVTVTSHEEEWDEMNFDYENGESDDNSEESNSDDPVLIEDDIRTRCRRKLKYAFLSAGLTHQQGNIISKTLREEPFQLVHLPKDARTILNTPSFVASRSIHKIAGGEYLHVGFKNGLLKKLESIDINKLPEYVEIDFSTDGANLDRKGSWCFWPHQFRILNIGDKRPVIAGVYKGRHKPSNAHEFFEPLITEITEVIANGGIDIKGQRLPLRIRCFIGDAPARAMVFNHFGQNSSKPCSKCKVEGTYIGNRRPLVYLGTQCELRTDEECRNCVDDDHHRGHSALSPLPMNLVNDVPFEGMHLLYLGNVKKFCEGQVDNKFSCPKLSGRKLEILNSRMIQLTEYCPTEFNRRPREITQYKHFKATEYRQFLLYTAPAVLLNVLDEEYYLHVMILHCVTRLLVSENTQPVMYDFCQSSLESYVRLCETLYGESFISYNVHGLLHVVKDVENLGPLESFSAFCYENNMPLFRKLIRKPHLPLQQFCKRLFELNDLSNTPIDDERGIEVSQVHAKGPLLENILPNCRQFEKCVVGKCVFSIHLRNNCFISKDDKIGLIENIVQVGQNISFLVKYFQGVQQLYDVGLTSESAGIFQCFDLSNELCELHLNEVKAKCYRMPKWNSREGYEENIVPNEWICAILLNLMPELIH